MRGPRSKKARMKSANNLSFRGYLKHKAPAATLAAHCRTLASALYAGRGSGQPGGWRTSQWIATQARRLGLTAWHGRRSIFQSVPFGCSTTKHGHDSCAVITQNDGSHLEFLDGDDFLIRSQHTNVLLDNASMVFVGYGIVAQQYQWDDYADLDVHGKVVIMLPNDPGHTCTTNTRFQGEQMTYYGRWEYKYEEAARQGAAGVIIIHTDKLFGSAFHLVRDEMRRPFRFLPEAVRHRLAFEGICSEQFGRQLLADAGFDLDAFLSNPLPMGERAHRLDSLIQLQHSFDVVSQHCRNVLGMKKGKLFPQQCVLLCAHWDHLGKTADRTQPRGYYPGAVDNAIGVSVLLELSRRLAKDSTLRRSVLFAWTTAEEVGMLGSAQVTRLIKNRGLDVVAVLNVDGVVPIGKTHDLGLVDGDQSDLPSAFVRASKLLNRKISFDDAPRAGYFYRSDQASFAKIDIPSVQITTGTDLIRGGTEEGQKRHDFYDFNNYHSTSDTFNKHWDFRSICADIDIIHETLMILANSTWRPRLRSPSVSKEL